LPFTASDSAGEGVCTAPSNVSGGAPALAVKIAVNLLRLGAAEDGVRRSDQGRVLRIDRVERRGRVLVVVFRRDSSPPAGPSSRCELRRWRHACVSLARDTRAFFYNGGNRMLTLFAYLRAFLRTRHHLGLEILALRQQVAVLKRKHPRPRLNNLDRLFWLALRPPSGRGGPMRSSWSSPRPSSAGIARASGSTGACARVAADARSAATRSRSSGWMARENPSWGAPRIHGELLKLGYEISERTVSRYLARRLPRAGDARQELASRS